VAHYNTVLSQLLIHVPRHQFDSLVNTYQADRYVKRLTTWSQFTTLLYAQASGKDSLRDIQNGLAAHAGKLYHLGLPERICRSTFSEANAKRDWHIYQGIFYKLLERCRAIAPRHDFPFKNPLISLDSSLIELCLSMFPWAKFNKIKGAIKLHYQFDHSGQIPTFMTITERRGRNFCHDLRVAQKHLIPQPDSIYCFDRGYHSFLWFRRIHKAKAFFVTRPRKNIRYTITGQQKQGGNKAVLADLTIQLKGTYSPKAYPDPLRLVRYFDAEGKRTFDFLTNNFELSASAIAQIYKARWQIEAFFKWIKQNLKIKTFLGTSRNAVLTQIWAAMCYYLLLAYMKFQSKYRFSLFYLHRIIRATLLERFSLIDILSLTEKRLPHIRDGDPQLCLAF
jgi:hypothetical protein